MFDDEQGPKDYADQQFRSKQLSDNEIYGTPGEMKPVHADMLIYAMALVLLVLGVYLVSGT